MKSIISDALASIPAVSSCALVSTDHYGWETIETYVASVGDDSYEIIAYLDNTDDKTMFMISLVSAGHIHVAQCHNIAEVEMVLGALYRVSHLAVVAA